MRKHLVGMTAGLWLTTILVAVNNSADFYGTWVCVAIASALSAGLYITRKKND